MLKLVKVYFFMSMLLICGIDVQAAQAQPKKWYEDLEKLQSSNTGWCFAVSTHKSEDGKKLIINIEDTALSEQAVLKALQTTVKAYNIFAKAQPREYVYSDPKKSWCFCRTQKAVIVYSLES